MAIPPRAPRAESRAALDAADDDDDDVDDVDDGAKEDVEVRVGCVEKGIGVAWAVPVRIDGSGWATSSMASRTCCHFH